MNPYRKKIWAQFLPLLNDLEPPKAVLDFGCGDGWFASQIGMLWPDSQRLAIDIKRRDNALVEPIIYAPGAPLPFPEGSVDLVYAVDVLHHCNSPEYYLDEISRVSRHSLLIKDHTYTSWMGYAALAILDELGNRKFGIPSPQNYQHGRKWTEHLAQRGWRLQKIIHPCPCHTGLLGALTNPLQYIALYQRSTGSFEAAKLQSR
ncbi:MAG TPA: class I SAM-dependent methyltransferase [Rhodocyclaceae bacterium]|nr:class I SAM-dependent methyltransferase [Rhodocyclaceae bacterium]